MNQPFCFSTPNTSPSERGYLWIYITAAFCHAYAGRHGRPAARWGERVGVGGLPGKSLPQRVAVIPTLESPGTGRGRRSGETARPGSLGPCREDRRDRQA